MQSNTFFRDNVKSSPFVSLMSKPTFDEPKSPSSPLSPGNQKRVRFFGDTQNDLSALDDQQSSILFRQTGIGGRANAPMIFDEFENSRRITSNFLFNNASLPYDFGAMAQMGMEQAQEIPDLTNNTLNFVHTTQRTNLINDSGNDGTWLTVFGFRTIIDARTLIDEFSRFGVIEKYVIIEDSNLCHLKFATRLQAQRALAKHGHVFGQTMIGVRHCTDKDIIGLKPITNTNVYLENPFVLRSRHRPETSSKRPPDVRVLV